MSKCVIILSGGLDSSTLAYWHKARGDECLCLSLNYGQRHIREIDSARKIAERLGYRHTAISLSNLTPLLPGSSLTDQQVDTPHGHYAEPSMLKTVVPGRNAMMLSIAWGVAVANQLDMVSTAIHAGDHFIYPDCRPDFASKLSTALQAGTEGMSPCYLLAPFIYLSKADIVRLGASLGVPYADTYTCYEGKDQHCGLCGACQERKEAFLLAGVVDPTDYAA